LAASLAAFFNKIPIAHVEAGLRTYNIYSPWPEEINRQLIGRLATYHFSPTILNKINLLKENVKEELIFVTGNTVIDALQNVVNKIKSDCYIESNLRALIKYEGYNFDRLNNERRLVLITGHRRENFGSGFVNICHSIKRLTELYPNVDFVYPVHLNPNVQKPVKEILNNSKNDNNIFLINPIEYLPFIYLMNSSYLVLTDSGGIQEEAPSLGKPVLLMRDTTERPEAVKAGTVKLVGTNIDKIVSSVSNLLDNDAEYKRMSSAINPYGDGTASTKIVESLIRQIDQK
jgi:UDP-N-acetylglucosamine 2-epimerase (non-hydrolysing)